MRNRLKNELDYEAREKTTGLTNGRRESGRKGRKNMTAKGVRKGEKEKDLRVWGGAK